METTLDEKGENATRVRTGFSRRTLMYGVGGLAVTLGLGGVRYLPANAIVRPPGGQDEDIFLAGCTRCERCLEACPRDVIRLCRIEDGVVNILTPQMDFRENYCDFCKEENGGIPLCEQACPSSSLHLSAGATQETTIIGKAHITEEWCLAYLNMGCHACFDVCPYEAIELDSNNRPVIVSDACNGCGACEAACVSLTNGSRSLSSEATSRAVVVQAPETER
jgi:ferredoxin-type protein NapG